MSGGKRDQKIAAAGVRFVERKLGDSVICRCGATLEDYVEKCIAGIASCPGSETIFAAEQEFYAQVRAR